MKIKYFGLFILAALLLTACGDDEVSKARAVITFDESSTLSLGYDDTFTVKGQITIPGDVELNTINIYCQEYNAVRPQSHLCATLGSAEIKEISSKLYEFEITQANEVAQTINGIVGIKIDVTLKSQYASSKTWELKDTDLRELDLIWKFNETQGGPGEDLSQFGLKWDENENGLAMFFRLIRKAMAAT